MSYTAWKRGLPQKCACFVVFGKIKKRPYNTLCVLNDNMLSFLPEAVSSEWCTVNKFTECSNSWCLILHHRTDIFPNWRTLFAEDVCVKVGLENILIMCMRQSRWSLRLFPNTECFHCLAYFGSVSFTLETSSYKNGRMGINLYISSSDEQNIACSACFGRCTVTSSAVTMVLLQNHSHSRHFAAHFIRIQNKGKHFTQRRFS